MGRWGWWLPPGRSQRPGLYPFRPRMWALPWTDGIFGGHSGRGSSIGANSRKHDPWLRNTGWLVTLTKGPICYGEAGGKPTEGHLRGHAGKDCHRADGVGQQQVGGRQGARSGQGWVLPYWCFWAAGRAVGIGGLAWGWTHRISRMGRIRDSCVRIPLNAVIESD